MIDQDKFDVLVSDVAWALKLAKKGIEDSDSGYRREYCKGQADALQTVLTALENMKKE